MTIREVSEREVAPDWDIRTPEVRHRLPAAARSRHAPRCDILPPMPPRDAAGFLRASPVFATLPAKELEALAAAARHESHRARETCSWRAIPPTGSTSSPRPFAGCASPSAPPVTPSATPSRRISSRRWPRHPHRPRAAGHDDVTTTMIYTHVLNRGPAGVISPADRVLTP